MGCGMVRKVDELGRVVIPKEMRRILNIKTGSSIEMFINDENQVVLKKFSELSNLSFFAENLAYTIFENFNLPCFVCDEEIILSVAGASKKEFLGKKIKTENFEKMQSEDISVSLLEIIEDAANDNVCINKFPLNCDGFKCGHIVCFNKTDKMKDCVRESIIVLTKFFSSLLNY